MNIYSWESLIQNKTISHFADNQSMLLYNKFIGDRMNIGLYKIKNAHEKILDKKRNINGQYLKRKEMIIKWKELQ